MQRKKVKTLLIVALSLVAVTLGAIGLVGGSQPKVSAQTIEISGLLESRVALNTEVEVPSSVSVEFEGARVADRGVVVFPDGKIVNAGKIKLNQAGVYQLKYFFDFQGVTHTAVQSVEVYSSYFNLSNPSGGEIIVSDEENGLYTGKEGIIVNLKSGTSFVYNKVLDLRECGEDGLSNIIEIDTRYGHFDEEGNYVRDIQEAWIRLTDCYNPNIYMDLRMQNSDTYTGALYPGVKTNNQVVTGMDKGITQVLGSSRIIVLDGLNYRVWQDQGSMNVGLYNMKSALTTGCVWKYDMKTQRVYLTYNNKEDFLVSDLDEPLIYTNGVFFPGFTTGEVYVSVFANGYSANYARTEIISIGNDNLKEVADKQCVDTFAPIVTVQKEKTTQTGVYGAIGDQFEIPEASAIDVNLLNGIDVAVYRGYNTNAQLNVSVEDNKFTLSEKEVYTIVYTARDKSGNEGIATFTVSAISTPDNRAITLDTIPSQTVEAGTLLSDLYQITNSINVNKEDVKVKISVESEHQTEEGEGEDFAFTPYYAGAYTLRFNYTDGVFNYEKVVNLQCEASSKVAFMDEVSLPKYYIKGNTYAIDNLSAYTFTSGKPGATQTTVYAVFDDGAEQLVSNPNAVQITGNSSVYFIYKSSNGVSLVTDKVSIINADYYENETKKGLDMAKFFIGNYTSNALNNYGRRGRNITFTSNVNSGSNKLSYFNKISGRRFALEYKIVSGEANFASLRITLTDATNAGNQVYLDIFNNKDSAYYSVNGGMLNKADLIKFENAIVTVSYDYESKFLRIGSYSTSIEFNAREVYLEVEMMGIKGKSSIIISKINNTPIAGNTYSDNVAPEIYVHDFQGDYVEGDTVKIKQPEFADVISGIDYSRARLLLTCSDGQPVLDASGNPITNPVLGKEYEILLDRIAIFYAIYEVYDFNGNMERKTVTINCADSTAPTIALGNIREDYVITTTPGAEICFEFTVSDNVTKAKELIVYIHLYCEDMFSFVPNVSNIKQVNAPEDGGYKEKFTIPVRGRYTAKVIAIDEVGNESVKNISIIVE